MADARRIVFGASVIPQETHATEEGSAKASILSQADDGAGNTTALAKTLGSTDNVTITSNQWGEGWTSMQGFEQVWEDMSNHWEDEGSAYTGIVNVSSSAVSLYPTTADVVAQTYAVKFVYVKNVGDNAIKLAIDGTNYDIIIPSKGSVSFRGDGTNLQMNDLLAQRVSSDSSIEFILAT